MLHLIISVLQTIKQKLGLSSESKTSSSQVSKLAREIDPVDFFSYFARK